jgi:hypothetical protein
MAFAPVGAFETRIEFEEVAGKVVALRWREARAVKQ